MGKFYLITNVLSNTSMKIVKVKINIIINCHLNLYGDMQSYMFRFLNKNHLFNIYNVYLYY